LASASEVLGKTPPRQWGLGIPLWGRRVSDFPVFYAPSSIGGYGSQSQHQHARKSTKKGGWAWWAWAIVALMIVALILFVILRRH